MKLYWMSKDKEGNLIMKSGKVLESGETTFVVEDQDSHVGAVRIVKRLANFTEEEAIKAYQDDMTSRLDEHRKAVEAIGKEAEVLDDFIKELALDRAVKSLKEHCNDTK